MLLVQVIGLQSTGEANAEAAREAHGATADDLISAPRIAMQQFIERNFPLCAKELDASGLSTLEFQVSCNLSCPWTLAYARDQTCVGL